MEGLQHSENRYYYSCEHPRQMICCDCMAEQEQKIVSEQVKDI